MKALVCVLACALLFGCGIREKAAREASDSDIAASVRSRLAVEFGPDPLTIAVDSTGAVVTLSGLIDSAEGAARAESIARSLPEVARVINNLQVVATSKLPPLQ